MKTFQNWFEENYQSVDGHPSDLEKAYIAGAEEKEREMLETLELLLRIKNNEISASLSGIEYREPLASKINDVLKGKQNE